MAEFNTMLTYFLIFVSVISFIILAWNVAAINVVANFFSKTPTTTIKTESTPCPLVNCWIYGALFAISLIGLVVLFVFNENNAGELTETDTFDSN